MKLFGDRMGLKFFKIGSILLIFNPNAQEFFILIFVFPGAKTKLDNDNVLHRNLDPDFIYY